MNSGYIWLFDFDKYPVLAGAPSSMPKWEILWGWTGVTPTKKINPVYQPQLHMIGTAEGAGRSSHTQPNAWQQGKSSHSSVEMDLDLVFQSGGFTTIGHGPSSKSVYIFNFSSCWWKLEVWRPTSSTCRYWALLDISVSPCPLHIDMLSSPHINKMKKPPILKLTRWNVRTNGQIKKDSIQQCWCVDAFSLSPYIPMHIFPFDCWLI